MWSGRFEQRPLAGSRSGIDYGAVRVFLNEEGQLKEFGGLGDRLGWWNSVATADLDRDGRMDIIAGNAGLNTKGGKLEPGKAVGIFYGEMDDSAIGGEVGVNL